MTFDNGSEFSAHEIIAEELNADIYFARPYHSWERGLNENCNGLLRQYFPKKMDLSQLTVAEVECAVDNLNHRPRKVLGFKSAFEVFFDTQVCYARQC